jgi:hypothetical protein
MPLPELDKSYFTHSVTRAIRKDRMTWSRLQTKWSATTITRTPEVSLLFCIIWDDVVYSFGETEYYYDQFYDPFRNYPAPIFAVPGNHDGMVAPNTSAETLAAFLENFCASGQPPHRTPESGGLARTAQVQPGVYFTLEAPFVRILGLYSNCLEDPGVISDQDGIYPLLTGDQLTYLEAALQRVKKEKFSGALIIAVHHPPYVAQTRSPKLIAGRHGGSPQMLQEIDAACDKSGVWPHAVLSGHAHNYQRFTRTLANRQTPFVVAGNGGGHALQRLTSKGMPTEPRWFKRRFRTGMIKSFSKITTILITVI